MNMLPNCEQCGTDVFDDADAVAAEDGAYHRDCWERWHDAEEKKAWAWYKLEKAKLAHPAGKGLKK